jgi:hypothetical protein
MTEQTLEAVPKLGADAADVRVGFDIGAGFEGRLQVQLAGGGVRTTRRADRRHYLHRVRGEG